MRIISTFVVCVLLFRIDVFAELSSSSCDLLRTATSLTTIVPEIAQLAMRYYRASSSVSTEHRRQKRFLFNENASKNVSSNMKGTVVEQMIANAVRDINFTSVAILIMNNNETMNKIRQNVDNQAIIRSIIREINYEKLGGGLLYAAETEFDLEHFIASILNITRIDIIHDELFTNGTVPEWVLKKIHPDLTSQIIQRTFSTLKNVTYKFVRIMSKSNRFDNYLFDTIIQQAMTPLSNMVQGVKEEKPKTLDQLIEIIVNNVNKVMTEQLTSDTKKITTKKTGKKSATSTAAPVDLNNSDDVKLMLYQWSIAVDSMGQTARIILKSLEQLYCAAMWE